MRGKQAKIRKILPDAVYSSTLVAKFVNNLMLSGKRSVAEKIVYKSLENLEKDLKMKPVEILEKAIENAKPKLEVRPRRVGGVNYQVPLPVAESRQLALAIKWIIRGARDRRKNEEFNVALAQELKEAFHNTGFAVKKKDDMHKMAEANKAFAHFQW
jgi:small subunit ribosomal protein S7